MSSPRLAVPASWTSERSSATTSLRSFSPLGPLTSGEPNREIHVAFAASDRAGVEAFFDAARGLGAEVLHEPRVWPEYHEQYYGAFVRDPDGNNVEAVCHAAE